MSFNIAVGGLNAVNSQLNTISNNIANANTVGFKAGQENFSALYVDGRGNGVSDQGAQQSLRTDGSQVTGSSNLDMAISGTGFFALQDTDGTTKYSRAGYAQVDKDGNLVNNLGLKYLQSTGGAGTSVINVLGGRPVTDLTRVTIDDTGTVYATYTGSTTPEKIGQVALANFPNIDKLKPENGTLWSATTDAGAAQYGTAQTGVFGSLRTGALESSNVDLTGELVNLMSAQRNYQANTKVISTDTSMFNALFQAI